MAKFMRAAAKAGADGFSSTERRDTGGPGRRSRHWTLLPVGCALVAALLLMPIAAQALECSNGGAGPKSRRQ